MADTTTSEADDQVPDLIEAADSAPSASKLEELILAGNLQYKLQNYNDAAEIYSRATEMQSELNGEMNPDNAELLFRYGRCLFELAKSKSDVLGGKVAGETKAEKKGKSSTVVPVKEEGGSSVQKGSLPTADEKLAADIVAAKVEEKDGSGPSQVETKPFFQFAVDDNFVDSDEEEEADGEAEDEEDDFATAFEILDVARVLLERQLEALALNDTTTTAESTTDRSKPPDPATNPQNSLEPDPRIHKLKDLLAETHDQQAEIALENERFGDAVTDFRATLALRQAIYPTESELIAESHYKLSLALEFDSVTALRDAEAQEGAAQGVGSVAAVQQAAPAPSQVDEQMRGEARVEMERAIESCRLRVQKEEALLAGEGGDEAAAAAKRKARIEDVREMMGEMEQRLLDLANPPTLSALGSGPAGAPDTTGGNPLAGILGQMLGESATQQQQRIERATLEANDLSGLVKKRKKKPAADEAIPVVAGGGVDGTEGGMNGNGNASGNANGKRKLGDEEAVGRGDEKRAKTEEPT